MQSGEIFFHQLSFSGHTAAGDDYCSGCHPELFPIVFCYDSGNGILTILDQAPGSGFGENFYAEFQCFMRNCNNLRLAHIFMGMAIYYSILPEQGIERTACY